VYKPRHQRKAECIPHAASLASSVDSQPRWAVTKRGGLRRRRMRGETAGWGMPLGKDGGTSAFRWAGSSYSVVQARRGRYDRDGAVCIPHTAPFTSPAASRAVRGGVYPTCRLVSPPSRSHDVTSSANAVTLAPPPSLIDASRRCGCLPHRAVDAVSTPSFTIVDVAC